MEESYVLEVRIRFALATRKYDRKNKQQERGPQTNRSLQGQPNMSWKYLNHTPSVNLSVIG
jgi:hypothetical protein